MLKKQIQRKKVEKCQCVFNVIELLFYTGKYSILLKFDVVQNWVKINLLFK